MVPAAAGTLSTTITIRTKKLLTPITIRITTTATITTKATIVTNPLGI